MNSKEIPVLPIKANKEHFGIPTSFLFNQFVATGKFTRCCEHVVVILITKKAQNVILVTIGKYKNYLHFFITMRKFLLNYLEAKAILLAEQFGFRKSLRLL